MKAALLFVLLAAGCTARAEERDRNATTHLPAGAACESCHPGQAALFATSLHAVSASDPIYLAEFSHRRDPWCASCHAPGGSSMGCESCHRIDDDGAALHAEPIDVGALCASCHDFDFPDGSGLAMQDTADEWRRSGAPERCVDCHDPHSTPGRRDPVFAARALDVRVRASRDRGGVRVVFVLESRAGHAVPTGDLYRRLVVRAGTERGERRRVLMRRFGTRHGRRVEIADDRVPPTGARTIVLHLEGPAHRVEWSIALDALDEERAADLLLPETEWRTEIASGSELVAGPR